MKITKKLLSVLLAMTMIITLWAIAAPTTASAATPFIYINQDSPSYLAKDSAGYIYVEQGTNVRFWFDTSVTFVKSVMSTSDKKVMAVKAGGRKDQRYDFVAKGIGKCKVAAKYTVKDTETGVTTTKKITYKISVVKKGSIKAATPKVDAFFTATSGITLRIKSTSARNRIFYKNGSKWVKLADVNKLLYTDKTVKPGEKRTYTVRSMSSYGTFNSAYNKTGWSYTFLLETPAIHGFTDAMDGLYFSWYKVPGAVKYRIYRDNNGTWKKIADTTSTSYRDKNVADGKTYKYTIRCISKNLKTFTSSYNKKGWSHKYKDNHPVLTKVKVYSDGYLGLRPMEFEVKNDDPSIARYAFFVYKDGMWKSANVGQFKPGNAGGYDENNKFLLNVNDEFYMDSAYEVTVRGVDSAGNLVTGYDKEGWIIHPLFPVEGIVRKASDRIEWDAVTNAAKYRVVVYDAMFHLLGEYWTDSNELTDDVFVGRDCNIAITAYDEGICESKTTTTYISTAMG